MSSKLVHLDIVRFSIIETLLDAKGKSKCYHPDKLVLNFSALINFEVMPQNNRYQLKNVAYLAVAQWLQQLKAW